MPQRIPLFVLILMTRSLAVICVGFAQTNPQRLRPDEYDSVALIYNYELSALKERALFPICIDMPSGISTKPLLQYLRRGGFEVSDPSLCEPAMAPGGQHHPKDYPHGLRIFIDKPQRDSGGLISVQVETDDLTVRPGEHLARTLRRGTYHFKQNKPREWKITNYTKEHDSEDEKGKDKCDCAQPSPATNGLATWERGGIVAD